MTSRPILALALAAGLAVPTLQSAEDSVAELAAVAEKFVAAYNSKDLDAIVALYTPEAEILDETDALVATGQEGIRSLFEASFTDAPERRIGLEVRSVRQIAENLVVEEGLAHFSNEGGEEVDRSVSYAAILAKGAKGGDSSWRIASSRELQTQSAEEPDPLATLHPLEGDWVLQGDQMQMDLSMWLAPSGRFLLGSALVTTPAEGTMETEIRIGVDPVSGQVRWWTFDELGGFAGGVWQQVEDHWLVRTNGVTAAGETSSAVQELRFEDDDTIVWNSTHRFLDGEALPDAQLRLVRRPPAPSLSSDGTDEAEAGDVAGAESTPNDPKP